MTGSYRGEGDRIYGVYVQSIEITGRQVRIDRALGQQLAAELERQGEDGEFETPYGALVVYRGARLT